MDPILKAAYDRLTRNATRVGTRDRRLAVVAAVVRALVVVRESNRWDLLAFATMVLQTLLPLVHLPGVQAYLDATKADPALIMRNSPAGERLRRRFDAQPLYQGKRIYGWTFQIEGTVFLFAMTSAMQSEDEDLANPFTDDLITIVRRAQLTDVFAGPETRLVRRASLGHLLGDVLERHGVKVHTKLHPDGIDIRTNGWLWTIICRQAEEDLKITLTRLLTGRIFKVKRGQWDRGQGAMLVGYKVDEDGNISLGDARQQGVARLAFERAAAAFDEVQAGQRTGAEPELTPERIVADLAVAGAVKRSNKKKDRWGNRVAGASLVPANPRSALLTILRDVPAYATGQLLRLQGLPMSGLDERDIHGFPVFHLQDAGPEDKGFTIFTWTLPLPPGGWGSKDTLEKAFKYYGWLIEHDRRSAAESEWPLSGLFTAARGDDQFRLVHASGGYQWRRYPTSTGYSKGSSVAVGKFDHALAITRLVDAIVAKLETEGLVPEELSLVGAPRHTAPPAEALVDAPDITARRLDVESRYERARELAVEATSERARADYRADADRLAAELDVLDAQLAELAGSPLDPGPEPAAAEPIEIGELATLLSVLLDTAGTPVDPAVTELLSRLITGGTLTGCWDDADPWAEFEFHLRVQTTRGWRTVGPITFELGNSSQGGDRQAWHRRMRRVAELRMAQGYEIEELASRLGEQPTPQRLFKTLTQAVAEIFGVTTNVAAAMVDHPISSTRAALWAVRHGGPLPQFDGLDPKEGIRHVEVLRESYLAPGATWDVPASFLGGERTRRDVARWVLAHSTADLDAGAPVLPLARAMGWKSPRDAATRQARRTGAGGAPQGALVEKWSVGGQADWGSGATWIKDPGTGARVRAHGVPDDEKRLRIRSCPWCGTRTILQPIPCLEGGDDPVVCVTCRRKPDDPSHVFPVEYLQPWEGPYGRSATDDRKARERGQRGGTRLGPLAAMPTTARVRRAAAARAAQPSARART